MAQLYIYSVEKNVQISYKMSAHIKCVDILGRGNITDQVEEKKNNKQKKQPKTQTNSKYDQYSAGGVTRGTLRHNGGGVNKSVNKPMQNNNWTIFIDWNHRSALGEV